MIPAFNEADNLPEVVPELVRTLEAMAVTYEVLVIDDGSKDGSRSVIAKLEADHPHVRSFRHRRNLGKAAALSNGFARSEGRIVVMMDADGQDDPAEIPRLVSALNEDVGLGRGRRQLRNDRFIKRTTSRLYNRVTSIVTGVKGADFNSGLKVMTRDAVEQLDIYGELHRYIPVLVAWEGFSVEEVDVNHRSRLHGSTKYGIARFWRGMFDLITVRYLRSYRRRPFHFFGGLGILSFIVGGCLLAWMAILHFDGQHVGTRPALITGVLLVVVAVQLVSFGLLGELIVFIGHRRGASSSQSPDLAIVSTPAPLR